MLNERETARLLALKARLLQTQSDLGDLHLSPNLADGESAAIDRALEALDAADMALVIFT